jgi:hypothetical protein
VKFFTLAGQKGAWLHDYVVNLNTAGFAAKRRRFTAPLRGAGKFAAKSVLRRSGWL